MSLPAGFNPNNMSFGNIAKATPVIEIPRNTSTYTSWESSHRESLWSRFNNSVASIGNWFAEKSEDVLGWLSIIAMSIIVIAGIVTVIGTWIDDGFWMALFMAVGVCVAGAIIWCIAATVIVIIVNIVMYGLRFLFWNGWTLILALTLAGGFGIYSYANSTSQMSTNVYEEPINQTVSYEITASELNVRTQPSKNATIVGKLHKGDHIEVFDLTNGFAKIDYNGSKCYVSERYIRKI